MSFIRLFYFYKNYPLLKHRYFIELAYNGTTFNGWQIQKNAPSVQAAINEGLSHLCQELVNVVGCGRTDTGVHARNFYAHFDLEKPIKNNVQVVGNLNHYLSKEIVIYKIFEVNQDAHARFDATSRTYKYYILRSKDPFKNEFAYFYQGPLNVQLMNKGAKNLLQYSDFTSFSKLHTQVKTNICQLLDAEWTEDGNQLIFTISADRFLRNMVRAIVGTLLEIGRNKKSLDDLNTIIESKNRSNAGYSVPAKGLFLHQVNYPETKINLSL